MSEKEKKGENEYDVQTTEHTQKLFFQNLLEIPLFVFHFLKIRAELDHII